MHASIGTPENRVQPSLGTGVAILPSCEIWRSPPSPWEIGRYQARTAGGLSTGSLARFFHETIRYPLTLLSCGEYSLTSLNVYAGRKVGPRVLQNHPPSRRKTSRIEVPEDTWVYWNCKGREDVSRIRDLSSAGLFIETPKQFAADTETKLHFLVQEGEISAQAVIRHARPGAGLGLKFVSVREEHRRQLVALINRLRGQSPVTG